MGTNQICVECGSDDLKSLAPAYSHILECGNCGHPNDAPTIKAKPIEPKEVKCEICEKRKATTVIVKPFTGDIVNACEKCFEDTLDEEDE